MILIIGVKKQNITIIILHNLIKKNINKMKNRKILSLLAFLSISFAVFANNGKGIEFYKAGMFDAAKSVFLQQTGQTPDEQAIAAYYLGLIYANEQNVTAAAAQFQIAVEIAPKSPYGYIGQGRLALKNDLKAAEALFKKAEGLGKKNADVQVQIADAYFANNMIAKAETALEKAKKVNNSFTDIYLLEGEMLLKQTNSETISEAITRFNDAEYYGETTSKPNKLAFLKLAQMYKMQNRQDKSLESINKAIALDKDYLPAYIMLGDILLSQGKTKEAIAAYEKVINAVEAPIEVFESYAQTLYFDKQFEKSLEKIQMVLAQKPDNAVLHRLEAYNLYELERHEEGLQKIEKFLSSIPQNKHIYLDFITLGRFYTKQKNYEKAMESFNKAIALDAEKPEIYKEMALSQSSFELKNYEDAIRNFDKYFELNQNVLPSELIAYADICKKGAIEILTSYDKNTPAEENAAKKQLFNNYIEKGVKAYSDFIELVREISPNLLPTGFMGKADLYSMVDEFERTETGKMNGIAKPYYEEALVFMLENNAEGRFNRDIVNSYLYIAAYYVINKDTKNALDFYDKILVIDSENKTAIDNSKLLRRKK